MFKNLKLRNKCFCLFGYCRVFLNLLAKGLIYVHFPKTLKAVAFPKILAILCSTQKRTFLWIPKTKSKISKWQYTLKNRRNYRNQDPLGASVLCPGFQRTVFSSNKSSQWHKQIVIINYTPSTFLTSNNNVTVSS